MHDKCRLAGDHVKKHACYYIDVRKRTLKGDSTYYYTKQIKGKNGSSRVLVDKKISEKDFNKKLSSDKYVGISKKRYSFVCNKQYYRLDIIDDEYGILEIDPTYENSEIALPSFLHVMDDITNNENYQNINLAKTKKDDPKILIKK